jgi:surfeit locus 1 family protein
MTGFFLVMMPLLIALGHWQVQRGDYKRLLENQYLAKLTELPQTPNSETLSQPFQALRLAGRYHPETFMVDNQVSGGETGYWVYQVFEDDRVGRVLINRGFVASSDRQRLPDVSTPVGELRLTATVWPQLGLIPAWGSQEWAKDWPKRIQRANVVRMSAEAGAWPAELRLEPGQPSVLRPAPFASRLSDDTHRGYAATWFGLAVVLLLGYLYLGFANSEKITTRR